MASICASSSNSIRATGTPLWIVRITVSTRRCDRRKGADRGRNRLRNAVKPHRHLGDDAERAFRADEEPGQIVAGRRFAGAPRGADDPAVGQHDGQRQHVLAHRAVAHRVGARGAGRRHAAQRGVGARVDREEQPGVAQILVELLARDPGLDGGVEILGVDPQDPVHLRQVDADAAVQRRDMAFERGAGAEGDDRRLVLGAQGRRSPRPPRCCARRRRHRGRAARGRIRPCRAGRRPPPKSTADRRAAGAAMRAAPG